MLYAETVGGTPCVDTSGPEGASFEMIWLKFRPDPGNSKPSHIRDSEEYLAAGMKTAHCAFIVATVIGAVVMAYIELSVGLLG